MNIIEKNNLVDEAYNQLLQMIASGEWVEGSKLPSESQLCETLGVSRNTVRVALSKLNALGLIESRQGFGYSVRNLNIGIYLNSMLPTMLLHSRDLESITEFRIGVESEAAAVAAERATAEDLERMRVACEKAEAHMGDPDMFAKYDMNSTGRWRRRPRTSCLSKRRRCWSPCTPSGSWACCAPTVWRRAMCSITIFIVPLPTRRGTTPSGI